MDFPRKTFLTVLAMGTLVVLPEYVPELKPWQMLDLATLDQIADLKPSRWMPVKPTVEAQLNESRKRPGAVTQKARRMSVEPLSDPAQSLASFYEAIERIEAGEPGAKVRLAHYGDSPTTADLITADIRTLLQKRFGDGGHGFYLIAKPWAWYGHRGVDSDSSGWDTEASNLVRNKDGLYGYGGVSFRGGPGSRARFRLKEAGTSTVEVAFRNLSNGGAVNVNACGSDGAAQSTAGDDGDGFARFEIAPDCKDITLRVEGGPVRLYGVEFLKETPGVVYDSLGLNGAYISVLSKFLRKDHWAAQLQHYAPDVVVINYGTNESVFAAFVDKVFEKELRDTIARIRTALPGKGILVMSPMDRGERNASGEIETVPAIERLVEIEKRVAADEGVAFFNTFEAMGGNGTMRKWYTSEPRLVGADFIHPMPGGARIIGDLLFKAMMDGYNRFKTDRRGRAVVAQSSLSSK